MQILTSGTNTQNTIGQRYEVISTFNQARYEQILKPDSSSLEIHVSIASPSSPEWSSQFNHINQNTILLLKCLKLLHELFSAYPEGLEEASEELANILEYHQERQVYLQQSKSSLPQDFKIIPGRILPSEVRPPLIMDFE
jgi:hypothetical protein